METGELGPLTAVSIGHNKAAPGKIRIFDFGQQNFLKLVWAKRQFSI